MSRHQLPPATVIDGRSLYTAGDMRAYYDLAINTNAHDEFTDPEVDKTKPESFASVDDLMKMFGMTK